MSVTWHSFDLRSGRRGQQLVTDKMGTLERIIGEATGVDGLPVHCRQVGFEESTLPGRTMLVALNDHEQPIWGGFTLRQRSTAGAWVGIDLVSLEGYFERRFVGDHTYTATPQGAIVSGIVLADVVPDGVQFVVDANSATERDRTYVDDEDKTVLSVLEELMEVEGGPEFTVDLEWANASRTILNRVLRVRDRIGTASTRPIATFDMPGCVTSFDHVVDFSSEHGANDVMAVSSGEGAARPESAHQLATAELAGGWVKFQDRFTPSTSITDIATLNAHARARLEQRRNGLTELSLVANLAEAPRLNEDWWLGDDVAVSLTCERFPERVDANGYTSAGYLKNVRSVGWSADYDAGTVSPKLWEVG